MTLVLALPLGLLIGLSLGALGGGGSILSVPALVYALGEDARHATTTSLLVVGAASLAGAIGHWRAGRVRVLTGTVFGLTGVGGSLLGSAISRGIDANVLLLAFSGLIGVVAWRMLRTRRMLGRSGRTGASARSVAEDVVATRQTLSLRSAALVLVAGTVVGFLTGLFGVGGGFVIVPALVLALRLKMPDAVGTSLLVIALNALVALVARGGVGNLDWSLTGVFGLAAILGAVAGKLLADRLPARRMIGAFAGLLVAVGAYTAARSIAGLAA